MSGDLGFEGLRAAIKTRQLASFERESPLGPRWGKSSLVIGPQDFAFIRFFFLTMPVCITGAVNLDLFVKVVFA